MSWSIDSKEDAMGVNSEQDLPGGTVERKTIGDRLLDVIRDYLWMIDSSQEVKFPARIGKYIVAVTQQGLEFSPTIDQEYHWLRARLADEGLPEMNQLANRTVLSYEAAIEYESGLKKQNRLWNRQ